MAELIRTVFLLLLQMTLFFTVILVLLCAGALWRINKGLKGFIKIAVAVVAVSLCVFLETLWVVNDLFPISLAYHEITYDLTEEYTGTVQEIERVDKFYYRVKIDGTEYRCVYYSDEPEFMNYIKRNDSVVIQYGQKSKCIFNLKKLKKQNDVR